MLKEPVIIYVFSGSGNTWTVARKMADELLECGVATELRPLRREGPGDISRAGTLGIAFPVAMFTAYPFVWEFVGNLPDGKGMDVFMVDTLAGFSGGVVGPMRDAVSAKGFRPIGAKEVRMPSNYARTDPGGEKDNENRTRGLNKAASYARDLFDGKTSWRRVPIVPDLVRAVGKNPDGSAWRSIRRKFPLEVNSEKCTRCGLCLKLCPVGNITMEEIPRFGKNCFFCQRCISFCPEEAISVSGKNYVPYRGMDKKTLLEFLGI
ncbi:MAG TPA: EFR1 family ferrodoxin [Synergistales bacterium]|jgi:ferredoxin|nr:EFR1 family ferrodoxin [Synergistales bacterium]HRV70885.1 EFR1 family ferrodoxin [Thermovirgaceae bacterium]